MNTILPTVLGLVLATATTAMTANYGGEAFNRGSDRVVAAAAISTASQIASAVQLYDVQEGVPYAGPSLEGLVESDYLRSVPSNPAKAGEPLIAVDPSGDRVAAIPLGKKGRSVCSAVTRMASDDRVGCLDADGLESVYVRI